MNPRGRSTGIGAARRRVARWVKRWRAAVASRRQAAPALTASARRQLAQPGRVVSAVAGTQVIACQVDGLRPWRLSEDVAQRVGQVLEGLGVEHWATQPLGTRITQWSVRVDDLPKVVAALATELGADTYYLQSRLTGGPRLIQDGLSAAEAGQAQVLRIFRYLSDAATGRVVADAMTCELHAWSASGRDTIVAPGVTGIVHELDAEPVATVPVTRWDGSVQPRPAVVGTPDAMEIDFAVDAVYMWVDDSDPAWRARRDATLQGQQDISPSESTDAVAAHRYRDRGELRASLRSLEMYAPWIRRVFLVTDGQRPAWLDPHSSRVTVVDHREIFPEGAVLPTFNSKAIGAQLHRIPGLADRYLVMNDDVMFYRAVTPYDLFTPQGLLRVTFSRSRLPQIAESKRTALEQARANSAQLIEQLHGHRVTKLFTHVPIPQSLQVAREIEERFATEIAQTLQHPFRSAGDVEVNGWLHLYHALFTGRALMSRIPFAYFGVDAAADRKRMADHAGLDDVLVVCVNDRPEPGGEDHTAFLRSWLERTWPVRAAHELRADPDRSVT